MPRGTKLSRVREMTKAELGISLSQTLSADNLRVSWLIHNKQILLVDLFDWPFLEVRSDVAIVPNTTLYTAPTNIDFERPVRVEVDWNTTWQELDYGVGSDQYNVLDVDVVQDPVQRWRFNTTTQIEVWPKPATAQTLRFTGLRPLTTLRNGPDTAFDDNALLDLDDLLIALSVASDELARLKKPDAEIKRNYAAERLRAIRAAYPNRITNVIMGGSQVDDYRELRRTVKVVTVS